jgi:NADH dehydrogenase
MGGGEVIPLWSHLGALVPALAPVVELVNQAGVLWFFGKTLTLIVFIQWCRFTLPRLRIDQLMGLAWKVLLPAAFLNLILSAVYVTFGFLPFAIGVGLCLLFVLILALAYRNRLRPQTGGIQLVTVPRTPEVVGS